MLVTGCTPVGLHLVPLPLLCFLSALSSLCPGLPAAAMGSLPTHAACQGVLLDPRLNISWLEKKTKQNKTIFPPFKLLCQAF